MKRILTGPALPALTLGAILALAACGSSGSSSGGGGTTAAASSGSSSSASTCKSGSGSSSAGTSTSSSAGASSSSAGASSSSAAAYPAGPGSITVGSADFPENALLADIYGDAMAAKGVKVSKKLNIGERAVYLKALQDGSINFIPEYSGSILAYYDKTATATAPADVYAALQQKLPSSLVTLNYASAEDKDTITVTKATADKYSLKTLGDLCPVAGKMTLGAPKQFQTRADGVAALASIYGIKFKSFKPLDTGGPVTVTALKNGQVDAADLFSTDPSIQANNFVSLDDNLHEFAAQNVVPLVTKSKVTQAIASACNAVSSKLDTTTLAGLVKNVQTDKQDPDKVAKQWLQSNNIP
jgi:osmoprotectant transport system substrate-binding protein